MADTKITALDALTAADPANDVLPIVDVNDPFMAASGTTKKISINNILGASGTATLASATITGNLTVDTNTLFVDSANNRVGVVTATPAYPLDVVGVINTNSEIYATGGRLALYRTAGASYLDHASGQDLIFRTVTSAGGAGPSELMRLNSTGLGVGVSPAYQIHTRKDQAAFTTVAIDNHNAIAAGTGTQFLLIDGGTNAGWFRRNRDGTGNTDIGYKDTLRFRGQIAGTERTDLTIDTSGNVGIGVTPSYLLHTAVASGANRNMARFQVTGASNGLTITWNHATTKMIVNFSDLPTSSAGLASGDLWIDTAAGNTLKVA